MALRRVLKALAKRMPVIGPVVRERDRLREEVRKRGKEFVEPGHFYSAVPSLDEIRLRDDELFGAPPREMPGIELNEGAQLRLLDELATYYGDMPFSEAKTKELRYSFDNPAYRHSDAVVLYAMLRHVRPKRIVEVGSGHSSCVVLDTNELFLDGSLSCTFIEPRPGLLLSLIKPGDRKPGDRKKVEIIPKTVQEAGTAPFESLEKGDMLLVDSTHVSKIGSDVNHLLFEVMPRLAEGVYVHFHDVFYPFEYPKEWVLEGRAWNEAYLLRAFLQYNSAFEIVFFTTFMWCFHEERFAAAMPVCAKDRGGSIWLRKTCPPGYNLAPPSAPPSQAPQGG